MVNQEPDNNSSFTDQNVHESSITMVNMNPKLTFTKKLDTNNSTKIGIINDIAQKTGANRKKSIKGNYANDCLQNIGIKPKTARANIPPKSPRNNYYKISARKNYQTLYADKSIKRNSTKKSTVVSNLDNNKLTNLSCKDSV